MTSRRISGVLFVGFVWASPGDAFVKCRTADGKVMIVDMAPPGCEVENELPNPPADADSEMPRDAAPAAVERDESPRDGSAENAGNAREISARRRIERALNEAADELENVRATLATAPVVSGGAFQATADGTISQIEGAKIYKDGNDDLRAREATLLSTIANLKREFAELTGRVEERNGGVPPTWWSRSPRCRKCP